MLSKVPKRLLVGIAHFPSGEIVPFLAVQRPNSAHKKRRQSQIVLNSLEGSLPVQLPTRARLFPNVPRPPAPAVQAKHSNILPPPAVAGGQKAVPCRSLLAAADKNFRAKTIFFYRDGDEYFTGVRVPVSKARFRTMDALLDQLNESIHLPFGVRRLHTPFGMSPVSSLDDLKPYGKYVVASGARNVRGVDLEAMERRKRRREEAQRRWNFQQSSLGASHSSIQLQQIDQPPATTGNAAEQKTNNQHRPRAPTLNNERSSNATKPQLQQKMAPFVPITFRQVFFVLNGHPHRVYRALINPNRKGQLDQLLEEVSHGLQAAIFRMYSFDGDRILDIEQLLQLKDMRAVAVPRHEQLLLNGISSYDNIVRPVRPVELGTDAFATLPPIPRAPKKTSRSSKSSSGASSSNIKDPTEFDRMKKRKKFQNEAEDGVPANNGGIAAVVAAATAGVIVRRRVRKAAEEVQIKAIDHRSTTASSSHGQTQANATANSRADSDSGRPRTELDNELNAQKDEDRMKVEEAEEDEDEEEDDYPEEPEQLRSLRETEQERSRKRQRNKRKKEMKIDEEEAEAEEDDDAVFEHDGTGMETDHKSEKEDEEQSLKGMGQAVEDVQPVELTHRLEETDVDQKNEAVDDQNGGVTVRINRASSIQQKLGVYSDELERILYGEAAVKIQSAWRGYSTRKELQNNGLFRQKPRMMVNGGTVLHRHESKKDMYKTNDRHLAVVGPNPKSPIVPGTRTSRSSLQPNDNSTEELDSSSEREEVIHGTEFLTERKNETLNWDTNEPDPSRVEQRKDPRGDAPYTVTVITGNRWAADTEANLYINMHGSNMDSEKLWLKQEFTDWLHSSAKGQRFRQNQSDSFAFRLPSRLGIINRITVGHERRGYGAGVFIDRILVTEDEVGGDGDEPMDDEHNANDCRQFLFLCNRWFDSGQVDGRLERSVRLSAFYMISSIPVDGRVTRGRWEFVLHGGTNDGRGGTTAQLAITGFGTDGQATTGGLYDTRMATAPSEALMQLDFGDIGELLKIRLEIDGTGSSPDYFLNFVEFKDLDTDERFVVMCGKWLRWRSAKKGDQPFRELLAFHIGVEPLPLITYDGKIRAFRSALSCFSAAQLCVELYGDLGDTGHVLVHVHAIGGEASVPEGVEKAEENDNGRAAERTVAVDVPFKLEAVSVGRVSGVRVHFEPNALGEQIFEGLITLQNIFQKQNVWPLSANSSFVLSQIRLHESTHTPYRYVLNRSHLRERVADQQQQTTTSLAKELLTTEMEGISTRLSKRKSQAKSVPSRWLLQMSVAEGSTILPEVMLCGEKRSIAMTPVNNSLTDGILSFQLDNSTDFDDPFIKIRILSDGQTFLLTGTDQQQPANAEDEAGGSGELPFTYVDKVRMCDTANGDELRFPAADCMLLRHSVFELPVMWPDRPPIPILIYSVRVATGGSVGAEPSNPELIVQLNLFGELGDVGRRTLNPGEQLQQQQSTATGAGVSLFAPKTSSSFEFEATSIGDIRSAQLEVLTVPENAPFLWECAEIVVTDFRGRSAPFYAFKFASPFTVQCSVQRADVLPFTDAL